MRQFSSRRLGAACGAFVSSVAAGTAGADVVTLVADLTAAQEVPSNASTAFGQGRFTVDTDANTVSYRITFTGLSSAETAAHIHGVAGPGVNAGVLHGLGTGNPKVGVWTYEESLEDDILGGLTYVNVHSVNFPGGEIRGQIGHFVAYLEGGQENPAVATNGRGWGTFTIDTCNKQLHYHIAFDSLSSAETAAHIHGLALPGTNAGILHGLGTGSPKVGTWNYPPELEEAILNGQTYVNVHSVNHGGGEIRGQIVRTVVPTDGQQEVPPVASPGAANGYIAFNTDTDVMGYYFKFANLTSAETAAHIHGFAPPGVNAGILHNLGTGTPKKGTWNYGAMEPDVMDGLTYMNVHSVNFGGGEIRGQIFPALPMECASQKCPGDFDDSGAVDVADLLLMLAEWGPCGDCGNCAADLDGSCEVNVADLLLLLAGWGPCPG